MTNIIVNIIQEGGSKSNPVLARDFRGHFPSAMCVSSNSFQFQSEQNHHPVRLLLAVKLFVKFLDSFVFCDDNFECVAVNNVICSEKNVAVTFVMVSTSNNWNKNSGQCWADFSKVRNDSTCHSLFWWSKTWFLLHSFSLPNLPLSFTETNSQKLQKNFQVCQ